MCRFSILIVAFLATAALAVAAEHCVTDRACESSASASDRHPGQQLEHGPSAPDEFPPPPRRVTPPTSKLASAPSLAGRDLFSSAAEGQARLRACRGQSDSDSWQATLFGRPSLRSLHVRIQT